MPDDEMGTLLAPGPRGGVLRLSLRNPDPRGGRTGTIIVSVTADGETWKPVVEQPQEAGVVGRMPSLASGPDGKVALLYQWRRNNPRSKQIRLIRSDDSGETWKVMPGSVDVSGAAFEPAAVWGRDGSLLVVWSDERRGGRLFDIYARRSRDGGATWEPEVLVSRFPDNFAGEIHARPRIITDGGGRAWAIWVGIRGGRSRVYLARSQDGGKTWTDPHPLTGLSVSVYGHSIARAGDRLLAVWQDTRTGVDRIYSVASVDGGATWTEPALVDQIAEGSTGTATLPSLVTAPDGEAFVAWQDTRNVREDVFVARSPDGGRTWEKPQRMDADEPGTALSKFPAIARSTSGALAVVWQDDRSGFPAIYVRARPKNSPLWGPETRLTSSDRTSAERPLLLWVNDEVLAVAWETTTSREGPASARKFETRLVRPLAR